MATPSDSVFDPFNYQDIWFPGEPVVDEAPTLRKKIDRDLAHEQYLQQQLSAPNKMSHIDFVPAESFPTPKQMEGIEFAIKLLRNRVSIRKAYLKALENTENCTLELLDLRDKQAFESLTYDADMIRQLRTLFNDVFTLSHDQKIFINPAPLLGVPLGFIGERSVHWKEEWTSLKPWHESIIGVNFDEDDNEDGDYAKTDDDDNSMMDVESTDYDSDSATEEEEDDWDAENNDPADYGGLNKLIDAYSHKPDHHYLPPLDSLSNPVDYIWCSQSVIPYHPNQIVAEHYMDEDGVCSTDTLKHMTEAIAHLKTIEQKGFLGMNAYDFYRWRVAIKVHEHHPERYKRFQHFGALVAGMINEGDKYADPLLIYAVKLGMKIAEECPLGHDRFLADFLPEDELTKLKFTRELDLLPHPMATRSQV